MKITVLGKDLINIDEGGRNGYGQGEKVHLIKLSFSNPTIEKMDDVMNEFPKTNRFIIDDNIRFYNYYFKNRYKKYYVSNKIGTQLISFFKKNNKVLLDVTKLNEFEAQFVLNVCLADILENVEVMMVQREDYERRLEIFNEWKGNLIFYDDEYQI